MDPINLVFQGLGTLTLTAPTAGPYFVEGQSTLPTLSNGGGASALVVTVNVNGSPKYVGAAGASGFKARLDCAALDVITVVFSSAAAVDAQKNVIKTAVSWGLGE